MAGAEDAGDEICITQDGKVRKIVLKAGNGPFPSLHASCVVHYVGRLQDGNEVFMDTSQENGPSRLVAGRDSVMQGSGLNLAVATMQTGEKARVLIHPEYGYGSKGNFSFPSIPPNAHLIYDVELLGFDDVVEGRETSSMLYEERLEAADRRRLEGNELFLKGSIYEAIGKYTMGLSYMNEDFMFQLQGQHETSAQAIRCPMLLNLAACQLRISDFHAASNAASQVLAVQPKNAKALFRRGKARSALGQHDLAEQDFRTALKIAPKDAAIAKELKAVCQSKRAQQRGADDLFRGQFKTVPQLKAARRLPFWQRLWQKILDLFSLWLPMKTRTH